MAKFCKLFERNGDQVLVLHEQDDDGHPKLAIKFEIDEGVIVTVSYGFKDTDEGWDARDAALDKVTEEAAFALVEGAKEQMKGE